MSADGRFVAFGSLASNLVNGDTNGTWDIFTHQISSGEGWGSWTPPNQSGGNTVGDSGLRDLRNRSREARPLVLVNGVGITWKLSGFWEGFVGGTGGQPQWDQFVANFEEAYGYLGFTRYNPTTNPNGLLFVCDTLDTRNSIWDNARRLNAYLETIKSLPQFSSSPKFDLLGYSMGGLIARQWEHDYDWRTDATGNSFGAHVKRLRNVVTISTPHDGTWLANLKFLNGPTSVWDMTTFAMKSFNGTFKGFPGVRYSRVSALSNVYVPFLGPQNDLVVSVSSQSTSDWVGRGNTGDGPILPGLAHADAPFFSAFLTDVRNAPETAEAVYTAIYGSHWPLGPDSPGETLPVSHDSLAAQTMLLPSATINRYVSVPGGAGTLGLTTTWNEGDATFVAVEPGGRIINATVAAADPDIDYAKEGSNVSYVVRNPKPGLWTLRITGALNVPAAGTECRLGASDEAPTSPNPVSPILVRLGSSGRFVVSIEDAAGKLLGGVVESTLTNPTGSTSSLTFYDDGAHGDSLANDGLFGSNLVSAPAPGTYSVQGRITGTRSYGTASRLFSTSFDASPESGRIQGLSAVQATDDLADSDAYFDLLRVSVKLTFASLGTYMLSGDLVGPQGQFVESVTEVVEPTTTGVFTSVLKFRGQVIGEAMIDGPYTIQSVRLTDQTSQRVLTDYKALLGTTAAYSKLQFETITARTASPANHFDGTSLISIPLDIADPAVTIKTILGPNVYFPGPWQGNRLRGTAIKVAWRGARPSVASYLGSEDDTEFPVVFEKAGSQSVGCPYNRPLPINRFYVKNLTTGEVRTSTADAAHAAPWVNWSFSYQQSGVWKLAKLAGGNDTKLRPWFGYLFSTNQPSLEITFRD